MRVAPTQAAGWGPSALARHSWPLKGEPTPAAWCTVNVDVHEVNLDLVCLRINCHAGPVYPTKSDKLQRNKNAWVSILQS